jgi:hypothetical protein
MCTERVSELATAYARKTQRLITALQAIAVALGGQTGAWLAHRLGLPASRDTVLRPVRTAVPMLLVLTLGAFSCAGEPPRPQRSNTDTQLITQLQAQHRDVAVTID